MEVINKIIQFIASLLQKRKLVKAPPIVKKPAYPPILDRVFEMGFEVISRGDYHLNIIGVRSAKAEPNRFDDHLYCVYQVGDKWYQHRWNITTDPGTYWIENPTNKLGTACVVADRQYKGVWQLGKHRGMYRALVQTGNKISVYRDPNRDGKYDFDESTIEEGYFGINCHRATSAFGGSIQVDRWSAGCQVFQYPDDFRKLIDLCIEQRDLSSKFTYTLLNEWCTMEELEWDNE